MDRNTAEEKNNYIFIVVAGRTSGS